MSVYSQRSATSYASKRVTKNTHVDETLFGTKKPGTADSGVRRKLAEIQKVTEEVKSGELTNPNAIIIPNSEILRMKNIAVITTKEQELYQKKILEEQSEKQMAAAKAKKQRMLEIEEEKRKNIPPTQSEIEDQMKRDGLRNRAAEIQNEQRDEVKHMNQMIQYAKAVTVRDQQLKEKKDILNQKKVEERTKDLMMEVERLKKVKYYEELERDKLAEQKRKALEVVDQIKENEVKRAKIKEEKEKLGQEIIQGIKRNQEEDAQTNLKKKAKQRDLNLEIYEANQLAIVSKQEKALKEREEEQKIIKYNKEKAKKEAEYQAEQKRIKEEKEKEVARLRSLQEKANDRQSEMDALRAKRAVEKADRLAREKEKREAEQRAKMNADLYEARKLQSLEKERMLQEQAKKDRDEFQKVIHQQKLERDYELKLEQERKTMVYDHANQLKKQMALNEEKGKQESRSRLEEGKKIKDKLANEKKVLDKLKEEKVAELKSYNIPEKYLSDLVKKKIIV